MTDIFSHSKRSMIMSKIPGKDTKPEILVRKYLFAHGFRYRKNVKRLPGTPDIVLPKYKTVIFVNGCFWHGHEGCKKAALPATNMEFWRNKIARNIERDKEEKYALEKMGYHVIIVWQCRLTSKLRDETFISLINELSSVIH